MYGLHSNEACFLRIASYRVAYSWSWAQTLSLYKNASALVVAESEKA